MQIQETQDYSSNLTFKELYDLEEINHVIGIPL